MKPTGLCSRHRDGEDVSCCICYPTSPQPPELTKKACGCGRLFEDALALFLPILDRAKYHPDSKANILEGIRAAHLHELAHARRAGCEAQRKVTVTALQELAEESREQADDLMKNYAPESKQNCLAEANRFLMRADLCGHLIIHLSGERTPEQPMTQCDHERGVCIPVLHYAQPTTKRCGTCGSTDRSVRITVCTEGLNTGVSPARPISEWRPCSNKFHSQPTTGEAAHAHEDGKDYGCKDA